MSTEVINNASFGSVEGAEGAAASSMPAPAGESGGYSAGGTAALQRLGDVKSNLTTMSNTLNKNVASKREFEENRIFELRELASKVEKHLHLEVKRRAESDKKLQEMFEARMAELQDSIERKVTDRLTQMQLSVDIVTKRLVTLEEELAAERENSQRRIGDLEANLDQNLKNVRSTLDQEKVLRMEKEAQLLRKSAEDVYRLEERLVVEKRAREVGQDTLRGAIDKLSKEKSKADEKLQTQVLSDIDQLKAAVRFEHDEREQAEEQMVQAMDQIVKQVQDALQVVSK